MFMFCYRHCTEIARICGVISESVLAALLNVCPLSLSLSLPFLHNDSRTLFCYLRCGSLPQAATRLRSINLAFLLTQPFPPLPNNSYAAAILHLSLALISSILPNLWEHKKIDHSLLLFLMETSSNHRKWMPANWNSLFCITVCSIIFKANFAPFSIFLVFYIYKFHLQQPCLYGCKLQMG